MGIFYKKSDIPDHLQKYFVPAEIGLEQTPEQYIAALVEVFRCVRDVLADDGTLWLNIADSYASGGRAYRAPDAKDGKNGRVTGSFRPADPEGIKPKDLIGIPWMLAFALRADGWYLRSDIVWAKGNPMPESVMDRPTRSHEYIFLLTKRERYFYDHEAVKEPAVSDHPSGNGFKRDARKSLQNADGTARGNEMQWKDVGGKRNRRSVWHVNTKPYKGAHFATFPTALIEPCILAGSSERGHCPECGARWVREVERETSFHSNSAKAGRTPDEINASGKHVGGVNGGNKNLKSGPRVTSTTTGWRPTCKCGHDPVPDIVLDPFMGSGTTASVALQHGRQYLGCELNPEHGALQAERINEATEAVAA